MRNSPAEYLLRIDDLTPGMPASALPQILTLIHRYQLQPILAIVPDNRDPALGLAAPDPDFWPQMRALQSAGASIGLHGYRHLCAARGWGFVPLHRRNEFVGVPAHLQREWIGQGIGILRAQALEPTVWVAPRHGFDRATLRALHHHGISIVSDGFAPRPHRAHGALWIPQQHWEPRAMPAGLWTICLHPATTTTALLGRLESFLADHHARFTSVPRVLREWPIAQSSVASLAVSERLFALRAYARHHARRLLHPH